MMKVVPIILICLCLIQRYYCACPSSIIFDNSSNSCIFNINYTTSDCQNFSFINCTYSSQFSTNYSFCTSKCCDPSKTYDTDQQSLALCQQYLDYEASVNSFFNSTALIIALACSIGVLILIFAFMLCAKLGICQRRWSCNCFCDMMKSCITCSCCREQGRAQPPASAMFLQRDLFAERQVVVDQWRNADQTRALPGQQCPICLEPGANLQLKCKHLFHRKCFQEWFKKKKQCSICRCKLQNKAIIWCQKCKQKQRYTRIMQIGDNDQCNVCQTNQM